MQGGVNAAGLEGFDPSREVTAVVHGVVGAELGDKGALLRSGGSCDDPDAFGLEQLDGDGADASRRAGDEHDLGSVGGDGIDGVDGGRAGQAERSGRGQLYGGRHLGDERRWGGHVLAKAAVTEVGLHDHAVDIVARSDAVDPGADVLDGAGEVLAEHDGEAVLHHRLQVAVGYGQVEAVDGAGPHPDQDLALGRLRDRKVAVKRGLGTLSGDGDMTGSSTHARLEIEPALPSRAGKGRADVGAEAPQRK